MVHRPGSSHARSGKYGEQPDSRVRVLPGFEESIGVSSLPEVQALAGTANPALQLSERAYEKL